MGLLLAVPAAAQEQLVDHCGFYAFREARALGVAPNFVDCIYAGGTVEELEHDYAPGPVAYVISNSSAAGTILDQWPPPGHPFRDGEGLLLLVSSGSVDPDFASVNLLARNPPSLPDTLQAAEPAATLPPVDVSQFAPAPDPVVVVEPPPPPPPQPANPPPPMHAPDQSSWLWLYILGALAIAAAGTMAWLRRPMSPPVTPQPMLEAPLTRLTFEPGRGRLAADGPLIAGPELRLSVDFSFVPATMSEIE
jgi:hypothetical protein